MQLKKQSLITELAIVDFVAAISVGVSEKQLLLDLNYEEDSKADMDMNVVMLGGGEFIEVQGTAEHRPFSKKQLDDLLSLAKKGIEELIEIQKGALPGLELK